MKMRFGLVLLFSLLISSSRFSLYLISSSRFSPRLNTGSSKDDVLPVFPPMPGHVQFGHPTDEDRLL